MTAAELAAELLKTPKAKVVVRSGIEWIEVLGVRIVPRKSLAVEIVTVTDELGVPGVIVDQEE